jgi:steroid delta-isomerase-like uncharacterized protein
MSEQNKAIARRGFEEIWGKGGFAVLDEIYAPNVVLHDPAAPGIQGHEGIKQLVTMNRGGFPDLRFTIEDQIAEGDKVVTRWMAGGTHQAEFNGIPATGTKASVGGITISRFAGGKIVEENTIWDTLGLLQQLGVVPSMG